MIFLHYYFIVLLFNLSNCLFLLKVVEYILDRNACLLPAYFAITEIRKLYPEGQLSHWVCTSLKYYVQPGF